MIGELVFDFVAELIALPVLSRLFYGAGKAVLVVLSLGTLRMKYEGPTDREMLRNAWHCVSYVRDGRRYLHPAPVKFVGFVVWIVVPIAIYFAVAG